MPDVEANMKNEACDKRQAWRVVLLDDHPLVRDAYRLLIESEHDLTVLGCLTTSGELTAALRQMNVDVVLMDYRLADDEFDGVPLIQRLRSRFPATRLLVCSASDDAVTVAAVFLAGAQGFLSKAAPLEECAKAIRAVAAGLRYANGDISPRNVTEAPHLSQSRGLPSMLPSTAFSAAYPSHAAHPAARVERGGGTRTTERMQDCASSQRRDDGVRAAFSSATSALSAVPASDADVVLPGGLTIKEFDVLRCTRQGLSPTAIAAKFKRSVKTVSGHKVAAYRKIAIERDAQLYLSRPRSRDQ
jgi:DNA-binding NarL/FixJ family response regulator